MPYDISALFTNVPADETIGILARKAFQNGWFNKEYNFNITVAYLIELLDVSPKNQLFQFQVDGQVDRVAMGSPLRPLMAKGTGKRGHIVAGTLFLMVFLGLRKLGNICCGHKCF